MHSHPEPSLDELLWTVAAARIIFGPAMNIQAPPNLTPAAAAADTAGSGSSSSLDSSWRALLDAGINDWGEQQQQQHIVH
jgi:FO synthase